MRIISHERFYTCCPESPYPEIIFDLHITRMSSTYITGIIVPLVVASFVSIFTLLMPSSTSGSRPALNVSIMFTSTTIYFVAGSKLPDIGDMTLISRLYIASLVLNLLLTIVSVLSTAMNLISQEAIRNSNENMQRYVMYDKDKSGLLDLDEARAALSSLGIQNRPLQDTIFRRNGLTQGHFEVGLNPAQWQSMSADIMAYRPTVHYSLLTGPVYKFFAARARLNRKMDADMPDTPHTMVSATESVTVAVQGRAFGHDMPADESRASGTRSLSVISAQDLGCKKVLLWLQLLGWDARVQQSFAEDRVDVEALSMLSKDEVLSLGVTAFNSFSLPQPPLPLSVFWRTYRERERERERERLKHMHTQLHRLGVTRVGDATKLLLWAGKTMKAYLEVQGGESGQGHVKVSNPGIHGQPDGFELDASHGPDDKDGKQRAAAAELPAARLAEGLCKEYPATEVHTCVLHTTY